MSGETHKSLVTLAAAWLKKSHSVVLTEMSSGAGECPDAIGFTSIHSTLIECKATRSDFKADAYKGYRQYPRGGMGQFRYYMAPAGIIGIADLPEFWGLLEVNESGKVRAKRPASVQPADKSREVSLLISTLRRVTQFNPQGVSVRFYPILTGETATIGIEPEKDVPRPSLDFIDCNCKRSEGEDDGPYLGHYEDCRVSKTIRLMDEWDLKYKGRSFNVLPK